MKILVVDDHALIQEAMRGVLRDLNASAVMLEASNGAEALRIAASQDDLELVLLDLSLPDRDGMEVLAALRAAHPAVAVVMLSARNDRAVMAQAFDRGAAGFIPKNAA